MTRIPLTPIENLTFQASDTPSTRLQKLERLRETLILRGVVDGDKGQIVVSGGGTVWTLDAGAVAHTVFTASASYAETATSGEKLVKASGTITITLPTAVGNKAKLHFKMVAAGTVTIDGAGAETIDGALTQTLSSINQSVTLLSDDANWQMI